MDKLRFMKSMEFFYKKFTTSTIAYVSLFTLQPFEVVKV